MVKTVPFFLNLESAGSSDSLIGAGHSFSVVLYCKSRIMKCGAKINLGNKMIKFIVYNTWDVENCSVSLMVYNCQYFGHSGYESVKEAWLEFTKDIYAKYIEDVQSARIPADPNCKGCKTASLLGSGSSKMMAEKYKFCQVCGKELQDRPFNSETFMDYFCNLRKDTRDSYGESEGTSTRPEFAWSPWWTHLLIGAPKEEVLYISEYAELALLGALFELYPELKDEKYLVDYSAWTDIKQNIKLNF